LAIKRTISLALDARNRQNRHDRHMLIVVQKNKPTGKIRELVRQWRQLHAANGSWCPVRPLGLVDALLDLAGSFVDQSLWP
jgi:hypothetical protein